MNWIGRVVFFSPISANSIGDGLGMKIVGVALGTMVMVKNWKIQN